MVHGPPRVPIGENDPQMPELLHVGGDHRMMSVAVEPGLAAKERRSLYAAS
jgi:hypothetical protein